jgi:N-acetylglucosamine kinase-like BadF-type ATPase
MHVLGIDAGGTKTVCLLADEQGHLLARSRGPGANLQATGERQVEKVLRQVIDDALGDRDVRVAAVCLGIAGVDRARDTELIRDIMRRKGFTGATLVVNDALVALVAGAQDGPGVAIIAGTGSIAFGKDGAGHAARAGGWGYLLGDEGGGFWMGRAALSAVVRQFDGRGPVTLLTDLVLKEMALKNPSELVQAIYEHGLPRHAIADITSLVQSAAEAGDAVATEILTRAGAELTGAAAAVITRLGMRGDVFPTILVGGVFQGLTMLVDVVTKRLFEIAPRSHTRLLDVEPATGAVHLALAAARGENPVPTYV